MMKSRSYCSIAMPCPRSSARAIASRGLALGVDEGAVEVEQEAADRHLRGVVARRFAKPPDDPVVCRTW